MSYVAKAAGGDEVLVRRKYVLRMVNTFSAQATYDINDQLPTDMLLRVTPTILCSGANAANSDVTHVYEFRLYGAFSSSGFYDGLTQGAGSVGSFIPIGWMTARLSAGAGTNFSAYPATTCGIFHARALNSGPWTIQLWNLTTNALTSANTTGSNVVMLDIRAGGGPDYVDEN